MRLALVLDFVELLHGEHKWEQLNTQLKNKKRTQLVFLCESKRHLAKLILAQFLQGFAAKQDSLQLAAGVWKQVLQFSVASGCGTPVIYFTVSTVSFHLFPFLDMLTRYAIFNIYTMRLKQF